MMTSSFLLLAKALGSIPVLTRRDCQTLRGSHHLLTPKLGDFSSQLRG